MKTSTSRLAMLLAILAHPSLYGATAPPDAETTLPVRPDGAVVLFDGTDFSEWTDCDGGPVPWERVGKTMRILPTRDHKCERIQGIKTRRLFRDFQLHVEFNLPDEEKANSGVYLLRRYEVQILNSHGKPMSDGMCGSIYRQRRPDLNRCKAPGQWQSYDIFFRSPRYASASAGEPEKIEPARITVVHNGVVIHNNAEVTSQTGVGFPESPEPGPVMLQDHGSPVRFRNIWILPGPDGPTSAP